MEVALVIITLVSLIFAGITALNNSLHLKDRWIGRGSGGEEIKGARTSKRHVEFNVTTDVSQIEREGEPDELWLPLLNVLELKDGRLALPFYSPSSTVSKDALGPGMRLEMQYVTSFRTFPAQIDIFDEHSRQLEISLLRYGEKKRPWRTYRFSVKPSSRPNWSVLELEIVHRYSFFVWIIQKFIDILGPPISQLSLDKIEARMRLDAKSA